MESADQVQVSPNDLKAHGCGHCEEAKHTGKVLSYIQVNVTPNLASFSKHYNGLNQRGRVLAEYIWIDRTGINHRSKVKCLDKKVTSVDELPEWNYDGSSTG